MEMIYRKKGESNICLKQRLRYDVSIWEVKRRLWRWCGDGVYCFFLSYLFYLSMYYFSFLFFFSVDKTRRRDPPPPSAGSLPPFILLTAERRRRQQRWRPPLTLEEEFLLSGFIRRWDVPNDLSPKMSSFWAIPQRGRERWWLSGDALIAKYQRKKIRSRSKQVRIYFSKKRKSKWGKRKTIIEFLIYKEKKLSNIANDTKPINISISY